MERVAEAHAAPDEIELDVVAPVHGVDDRIADAEIEHHVAGVLDDVAGYGRCLVAGSGRTDLCRTLGGMLTPARAHAYAVRPEQSKPRKGSEVA